MTERLSYIEKTLRIIKNVLLPFKISCSPYVTPYASQADDFRVRSYTVLTTEIRPEWLSRKLECCNILFT